jgi:hypothetical protein
MVQEWRDGELKEQRTFWKTLPILLIGLAFLLVITHYLFFLHRSSSAVSRVKEYVVARVHGIYPWLSHWLGIKTLSQSSQSIVAWYFCCFSGALLSIHPRALAQNKLPVPDYDHYLFHLKINTVLMGMILIAGIDGALLDHVRAIQYRWSTMRLWYLAY